MEPPRPKVGIGLFVFKDNKILLAKRKGGIGAGEYGGPGGKLEMLESVEESILRELAEECGPDFKVKNVRFLCLTNLRKYAPEHFVDIGMAADWVSGEPKQMEPHKMDEWNWYKIDNLPEPLFGCDPNYLVSLKTGQSYFTE